MLSLKIDLRRIKTHANVWFLKMAAKYAPFPHIHL